PAATAVDGFLGAILTGCVGLGIAWVLGALALANGGEARREVQKSHILGRLDDINPPSSGLLATLSRPDPLPPLRRPGARGAPPEASIARTAAVKVAAKSVVKVLGTACGLGVEGSGWVISDELVVTNAHVVAGQKDTQVLLQGRRPGADAAVIAFDPK